MFGRLFGSNSKTSKSTSGHPREALLSVLKDNPEQAFIEVDKGAGLLVKYARKKNPQEFRYALCTELIGDGLDGEVYLSSMTLIVKKLASGEFDVEGKTKEPKKRRAVKYFFERGLLELPSVSADARSQYRFIECSPDIRAKAPVLEESGAHAALVMNFIDAKQLRGVVSKDRKFSEFTVDQRIQLTILIAEAILDMHARGIIHGDIKPENIFVVTDENNTPQKIIFCDFGHAIWANEYWICTGGTRRYMPPEAMPLLISVRNDAYAFAAMLQDLWPNFSNDERYRNLSPEHKERISEIMYRGVTINWRDCGRLSLEDMLAEFKNIRDQRYQQVCEKMYENSHYHPEDERFAIPSWGRWL